MTPYSRENPSPRYRELLGYYQEMHEKGAVSQNIPPEKTFDGRSLPKHASNIQQIINILGSRTILDYGSGKGNQYNPTPIELPNGQKFDDIKSFWGVESITCFDPGHEPFSQLPKGTFEGVVTTDVLEHCPKEDISWIVDEIFSYATEFVYVNVACYPAAKTLPNGENAHCTLEEPDWWTKVFDERVRKTVGLRYFAAYDVPRMGAEGMSIMTVMHRNKWSAV
ncbi:MAG: class I SAM-dependent methyltransferase [Rhodospirillaceae bacterium]|jgi:hypothetical protein|nr:class I SAM-dependent methyltransferase [Rhodospirillaceae bacterium]